MPETADRLTMRVMELLEEAQHSSLTHAEVIEELVVSLRRDLAYLARRARRGRQTMYDEVEERALRARARAIVVLQAKRRQVLPENQATCRTYIAEESSLCSAETAAHALC